MAISIELCCNDYRNGNFEGRAEFIHIGDIEMQGPTVSCRMLADPPSNAEPHEGDLGLRVGRLVVPCLAYKTWTGNWCWDRATVRAIHALRILNYLIDRKWQCEAAPGELLFDRINSGTRIPVDEFLRLWKDSHAA